MVVTLVKDNMSNTSDLYLLSVCEILDATGDESYVSSTSRQNQGLLLQEMESMPESVQGHVTTTAAHK